MHRDIIRRFRYPGFSYFEAPGHRRLSRHKMQPSSSSGIIMRTWSKSNLCFLEYKRLLSFVNRIKMIKIRYTNRIFWACLSIFWALQSGWRRFLKSPSAFLIIRYDTWSNTISYKESWCGWFCIQIGQRNTKHHPLGTTSITLLKYHLQYVISLWPLRTSMFVPIPLSLYFILGK